MAFTHNIQQNITVGGVSITSSNSYSASNRVSLEESVSTGSTDTQINVALDVSAVKSFFILATGGNITVETNSGSAADNTLSLVDGVPYVWHDDSYDAFLLDTDVTALFITNSSGSTVTIKMEAVQDATP